MSNPKKAIVTHHLPDLDAITATWLLKRFDAQTYDIARILFVDPGDQLSETELRQHQLTPAEVTHVDTGLGEFDHHQSDRGMLPISASSLVYDHVCQVHPDLATDEALRLLVNYTNEIDHFQEIFWPEPNSFRYNLMLHEILEGIETLPYHDDDSIMNFGFTCLDATYAHLTQLVRAKELITQRGQIFDFPFGQCLTIETENDDVIKLAQKQGFMLVIKKDPTNGYIRIKARPDAPINLKPVADEISKIDPQANWYYHASGKMLLNGSSKHRRLKPSTLTLPEIIKIVRECYVK